jgi:hypothetical protein
MRTLVALMLATASAGAAGQQVATSPAPEAVSVTVYRDPARSEGQAMESNWLGGYALITETRTVDLPAGASEIRFEGVAGTILPTSVIIRGLPTMPDEKNYDARLLSAGSLVEAALGRQVHLRRTNRATGKVTDEDAIIRSGPNGIIVQTAAGFEALRCTGLSETLVYQDVPPGLSAKPTLSIRAISPTATRATLQLSYLAGQFDWQANYVARLGEDGRTLDLFAWLTLANENDESFPAAQVNAIAGKPNRDDDEGEEEAGSYSPEIHLSCWPAGRTSDGSPIPVLATSSDSLDRLPGVYAEGQDIVVTGTLRRSENLAAAAPITAMTAEQEELGDLKLYRIPEPVTIAANGQKQVALMHKGKVKVDRLYSLQLAADRNEDEWAPVELMLRTWNNKEKGLGLPLPSGNVAIFEPARGESLLAGETYIDDLAVEDDLELRFGESPDVQYRQRRLTPVREDDDGRDISRGARYEVELTNATAERAQVEVGLKVYEDWTIERSSSRLKLIKGRKTWVADVPANGKAKLSYTLVRPKPRKVKDRDED